MTGTLSHYGVKGMKWGVQRDEAVLARIGGRRIQGETKEDRQRYKEYKKSTSRQERKADRYAVMESRAKHVMDVSMKNPYNFVQVGTPGYPTLMSGKEFVEFLSNGNAFNPMDTTVTDLRLRKDADK